MNATTEKTMICGERLAHHFVPQRAGKWQVEREAWPAGFYYPDYCLGSCTIMSTRVAHQVAAKAMQTQFGSFTMEDILFSGIVRINGNIAGLTDAIGLCSHAYYENTDTFFSLIRFYSEYCQKYNYTSCMDLQTLTYT